MVGLNADMEQDDDDLLSSGEDQSPIYRAEKIAYTNEIAAIVNNEIITMERVRIDVAPLLQQIQRMSTSEEDFRRRLRTAEIETLNGIINRKLIVDEFLERGGKFSEAYEKGEYENYLKNVFAGNRLELSKFLKEYGKSVREFKKDVKERAIVGFMIRELRASQMEVSPAKIKEYYDGHRDEFFHNGEIDLKQIVLINNDKCQDKLRAIQSELANGADFHKVAGKYSDDMGFYDMGYVSRGDLVSDVSQAIEGLRVRECSREVALGNAVCIFFIGDERPAKQLTLEEVSQAIEDKLCRQYEEEARVRWIQKLRSKAYIKIYIKDQDSEPKSKD
ncbi:MAG: peptidyl-prolyl cis-trans isomerase [Puniceicoccales bacterium]|jgi:peptidyl-prolyl cis-trans isomerase SurA|nr:peptidyl-prolyl cis-trans isomerase [Puniceicoccales bacterium]